MDNNAKSSIPTNQELVAKRIAVSKAKRQARIQSIQKRSERNYRFKELLENGGSSQAGALYAIKVSVCNELRQSMKLSGKEKRGRVFLEADSEALQSLAALQQELHGFFRALKKGSFVLKGGYPVLAEDGSILSSNDDIDLANFWNMDTDDDVAKTFERANAFFANHNSVMKYPSMVIYVQKDPNAPKPLPPPAYLTDMADPSETESMTMLSFYAFPPNGIDDPEAFATKLRKTWKPFAALGRVYVAKEGVNAQMSVPTNVLPNFVECCKSIPGLECMENGVNIDQRALSMEEFAKAGTPAEGGAPSPPFKRLHVRVRHQIVADGLQKSLDWSSAGYDMPPMEWHETLKKARGMKNDDNNDKEKETTPIVLDCRNTYETDVGIFDGAEPLGTESFRDSWDALKERLADTPKDSPIMTYCTGGIRCVKVGAYLTQEMGFKNVSRLAGGIIAYDRKIQESGDAEEPLFRGTNFVFDGRLGRPITEDAMGVCVTCGSETSLVSNCRNGNCHKRIIQCENCRTSFQGTCSNACKNRLVHGRVSTTEGASVAAATSADTSFLSLDDYSAGHSTPPPSLYREMEFNTKLLIPSGSHMVSGKAQGRLLKNLASLTRNGRCLELGSFTGYATACLVEGACNAAQISGTTSTGSRQDGPFVMSMERDSKAFDVAVAQMRIVSKHGFGEEAAEAMCAIRNNGSVEPVQDEIVSLPLESSQVGCELVHVSDALATLEEMAGESGVLSPCAPFDLVFVDADKTRLIEYADALLSNDCLLQKGGLIVVDNVLWKGLVLEASNNEDFVSLSSDEEDEDAEELRRNRRARKLANKMHSFNSAIAADNRAEVLVLPLRDGLSIIRKK